MSRDKLKSYLDAKGLKQNEFAAVMGVSQGCLSDLVRGRRKPSADLAFRIETMTGGDVPARGWFE